MTEQNAGNDGENCESGEREPRKFWPTLIDAIASCAAYNRAKAQQPNDPYSGKIARWTMITGVGTCAAAILAGAAAFVFWQQLCAMNTANRQAEKAFYIAQGALIAPDSDGAMVYSQTDTGYRFKPAFRNVGNTNAIRVRGGDAWCAVPDPGCSVVDVKNRARKEPLSSSFDGVGPRQPIYLTPAVFGMDDLVGAWRGNKQVLIAAYVEFETVFPGIPKQTLLECFEVQPEGDPRSNKIVIAFYVCPRHSS